MSGAEHMWGSPQFGALPANRPHYGMVLPVQTEQTAPQAGARGKPYGRGKPSERSNTAWSPRGFALGEMGATYGANEGTGARTLVTVARADWENAEANCKGLPAPQDVQVNLSAPIARRACKVRPLHDPAVQALGGNRQVARRKPARRCLVWVPDAVSNEGRGIGANRRRTRAATGQSISRTQRTAPCR